jgi:hypothetical protein
MRTDSQGRDNNSRLVENRNGDTDGTLCHFIVGDSPALKPNLT